MTYTFDTIDVIHVDRNVIFLTTVQFLLGEWQQELCKQKKLNKLIQPKLQHGLVLQNDSNNSSKGYAF